MATILDDPTVNCYDIIAQIASEYPTNLAIADGADVVNYRELIARADARAGQLTKAGIAVGDRIVLIAESSADYVASVLAIWKVEAVLVTIYSSSGDEDILRALTISDPVAVFVSNPRVAALIAQEIPELPVADIREFSVSAKRLGVTPNPDDLREPLSFVCFSSGTTSEPKAIMLAASTVANAAETYAEVWRLSPDERALITLPMAWVYGLVSTTLAVLFRAGGVIISRRSQPEVVTELARQYKATFLPGVTVTFAKLMRYSTVADVRGAFSNLRLTISGGEPRNEKVFDEWLKLTGSAVLDAYCASECIPLVTYDPVTDPVPNYGSAGKLVPRQKLRVVDSSGVDVAPGEVGEALAAGPGLMLGYWNNPQLTREAITDDGWYRMKDLVRIDEQGFVYVVGRLSDLIIRGGTNISPAEVEAVLNTFPDIEQSAVIGLADETYGQRIVAVVVATADKKDSDAILKHAAEHLSRYKVPEEVVFVDELPINKTTSKVDKKALVERLS